MAEPEVDDLDERLAHDFARLGFRAAAHGRRASVGADETDEFDDDRTDDVENPGADVAAQLDGIHELLSSIVRRLDWIDASLTDASGPAVLERMDRLDERAGQRAGTTTEPVLGGPEARRLIERIDALGELLIDTAPEAAPLSPDVTLRSVHRRLVAVLDASAQTTEQVRAQERQLADLTARIEELQRRLGV